MMIDRTAASPKGIFDRGTRGRSIPPVPIPIERGQLRFFAKVLGETDPIHFDVRAARAQGHPDLVAPPSFFMVIEANANEELARTGQASALALIKCDFRYLLHGDEHYSYHGLLYAGDEVSFETRIVDFVDKKGGAMELVLLESTVSHAARGVAIRARRTLLHRLPEQMP